MNKLLKKIVDFADGNFELTSKNKPKEPRRNTDYHEESIKERYQKFHDAKAIKVFDAFYKVASGIICVALIAVLLLTVSFLPEYGNPDNPVNNEVSERYLQDGLKETGAVNVVTGMILDYRAFDTFGESAVLYVSSIMVLFLLKKDKKIVDHQDYRPLPRDVILKNIAKFVIPFGLMFGIYLVLNGHISPGGGFSGGAIMGASLILYSSAYGYRTISKVITEKVIRNTTFCALFFYAIVKGFSFYTGANHIATNIPLGEPGAILSAGLILPLNICVGLIVTCTIYAFYSLFTKGEM